MPARTVLSLSLVSTLAIAGESLASDPIEPQSNSTWISYTLDCGEFPTDPLYQNRTNSPQTVNVHMETTGLKGGYAEHVDTNGRGKHLFDLWGSGSTAVSTVLQPGQSIHAGCGVAAKGDGCCVFDIEVPGNGQR